MRASALLVAACLMGLAQTASADWRRDYDLGRRAIDEQRWEEAERLMRSALREEGEPSARKRFQGARFDVYVPHFYAGLAAARRGDCTAAAELWGHAATRRVVDATANLAAQYREVQGACSRQLAQTPPPASTAAPPPAREPAAEPAPATSVIQTPSRPPATQAEPAASRPTTSVPASTPPAAATPRPAQQPPPVAAAANPAPAALLSLVESYLAGRAEQVLRFDPGSLGNARAQAQAYLLRAAVRHSQALLQGERLDSARDDIRIARQLDARLAPDESLFSPRFRSLWRDTR
jgi:hypothetical protein